MAILDDYQWDAINRMKTGCILCSVVGSGKSRIALGYYFTQQGGHLDPFAPMKNPKQLVIITTAHKRDSREWDGDMGPFLMSTSEDSNYIGPVPIVDSWNNIGKYIDYENAFFIFDEQRVVGKGAWVKAFYKITKKNDWILLSATPGDTWLDYVPVFIANGFYKNRTRFIEEHVIYSYRTKFPTVDRYVNTRKLERLRDSILVDVDYANPTEQHHFDIFVDYPIVKYKSTMKNRWNEEKEAPLETASDLCCYLRKLCNLDASRIKKTIELAEERKRLIIFYNFDDELYALMNAFAETDFEVAEWNGHKHQEIPAGDKWVFLVQYNAGCEGWNCIKTDSMLFYSQNYSYKVMVQAAGRIDRRNTPYTDLYYYHLKCHSSIDLAIASALRNKKKFNESRFIA